MTEVQVSPSDRPATVLEEPVAFFMVWTKKGRPPNFVHGTRESAHTEAARLARLYPGKKFIVLQAVNKLSAQVSA